MGAILLAALLAGVLLILLGLSVRNPILWRIGVRNLVRRPSQTGLMLAGLVLSTIFLTASFGLQDSFQASLETYRLTQMGNVDEAVTGPFTQDQVTTALAQLQHLSEVQAATGIFIGRLALEVTVPGTGLTTAGVDLYAVPPAFDPVYGPLTTNSGPSVQVADLHPNEVIVSATLAGDAALHAGETIQVTLGAQTHSLVVRAVLSHDLAVTTGELDANGAYAEIIMPLSTFQQTFTPPGRGSPAPNTLCVKNIGQGGLDDIGPGGSRSQTVVDFLEQFFHAAPDPHKTVPTDFAVTIVHPLKPDEAENAGAFSPVSGKSDVISSPAARQFNFLLPAFTSLLIAAGLLLLALLMLLLAAERRAELGMSRAIGLQRRHLIQTLLIEGGGYGALAALLGIPLGLGVVALGLSVLARLPVVSGGANAPLQARQVPLHAALSWQSALGIWSLEVLGTLVVVLVTALWISRMNLVAAIRDLDEPTPSPLPLLGLVRALWSPPRDAAGQRVPQTRARRLARQRETVSRLLWALVARGPLCLVLGGAVLLAGNTPGADQDWLPLLGGALLIAGGGLLLGWLATLIPSPSFVLPLARRLGFSLIGLGWISVGLAKNGFLFAFEPVWNSLPSVQADVLSMLLPLVGAVLLVTTNVDLLVEGCTRLFRRVRSLAPVSRTSLVYPLTFRFRAGVTVSLLALIVFLVMLLVTNNLNLIQQAQIQVTTGTFQLEMDLDQNENQALVAAVEATPTTLRQDIAAVAAIHHSYGTTPRTEPMRLLLPGQPPYRYTASWGGPLIVDDTYLSLTTMPLVARAQGYSTDRQVWEAVRDHPGDAVLPYSTAITGLPTSNGFTPFAAEVPENEAPTAPYHRITIIGLIPATAHWQDILLSTHTAAAIGEHPVTEITPYYFRLQPGVSEAQASSDLNRLLQTDSQGIQITSLDAADQNAYTADLTLFLAGYLGLGLLFGALSIGVIVSRAVVERRQQIGMLRALGFSRGLVLRSFLLEFSFLIALGLLIGSGLAWWLAAQVARESSQDFQLPLLPVALLFLGSFLVALVCTVLPARRASRLPPAEALRYE
jgi:ABC-type antimicrobial peptide transport system permease subunit